MTTYWRLGIALAIGFTITLAGAFVGCNDDESDELPLAAICTSNDECAAGLVCSYGQCRPLCTYDRDCPEGQICVAAEGTDGTVCWFPEEGSPPGSCDCSADQVCVGGYCIDPVVAEPDADVADDGDADELVAS